MSQLPSCRVHYPVDESRTTPGHAARIFRAVVVKSMNAHSDLSDGEDGVKIMYVIWLWCRR